MTERRPNLLLRGLRGIWFLIDGTRRLVFNIIFLLILVAVIAALFRQTGPMIQPGTALVLEPRGVVVEQYSSDPVERAVSRALGEEQRETRLRDLLTAIDRARDDSRIDRLILDLDQLLAIGPAQAQELRRAIASFRESGKPVLAYGEAMAQHQYYLAAAADEVWLHPEGVLLLEGYGVYRNYYKDALDKLDVDIHLFRVGEYKSAAEPFVRNDMSEESREANRYLLEGLWSSFIDDVARSRGLEPAALSASINRFSERLAAEGGSISDLARGEDLVDRLGDRAALAQALREAQGITDADADPRALQMDAYLHATRDLTGPTSRVAVVVAQGTIIPGEQPSGTIGGDSLVRQIRKARKDSHVRAIVLRVDSPGGAVLPSEKIRAELARARTEGLPVVVSMGTVAASGGYWISTASDHILAEESTITGSIGIFGMLATIPRTLANLGVYTDGVGTAPLSGAFRIDRELGEEARRTIELVIEDGYRDFLDRVASARDMTEEAVDRVARGRVWTGAQALERGLVDGLGGMQDAVRKAAELAGVSDYGVTYFEKTPTPFEQWLLDASVQARLPIPGARSLAALSGLGEALPEELQLLLAHPRERLGVYAFCFCRP